MRFSARIYNSVRASSFYGLSVCPSVRPSVRLSVKRVLCDKTLSDNISAITWKRCEIENKLVLKSYELSIGTKMVEEEWLVGATHLTKILGQPAPVGAKSTILNRYSLVAPEP